MASIRACSPRMSNRMWMLRDQYRSMSPTHMMSPGMRCIDILEFMNMRRAAAPRPKRFLGVTAKSNP